MFLRHRAARTEFRAGHPAMFPACKLAQFGAVWQVGLIETLVAVAMLTRALRS